MILVFSAWRLPRGFTCSLAGHIASAALDAIAVVPTRRDDAGQRLLKELAERSAREDVELTIGRAAWLAAKRRPKAARAKLAGVKDVPDYLASEVAMLRERPAKKR